MDKNKGEIIIYKTKQGPKLDVKLKQQTVWLTLDQLAALFNRDKSVVSRHIKECISRKGAKD